MNRPTWALLAILLVAAPLAAEAQQAGKVARIGVLSYLSRGDPPETLALLDRLRELGYVEGESLVVDWRGAHGNAANFPKLAAALVESNVEVIVATGNSAIQAARAVSKTIPIVMVVPSDPVGLGFIRSLAHPGGHTTGLTWRTRETVPKQLQLLTEVVPGLSRVAVLWDANEPARRGEVEEAKGAASKLGLTLQILDVRSVSDLEAAFATMARGGAGAVLIVASTMLASARRQLAGLAMKANLPAIGWYRTMAKTGLLMSFSPHLKDQYRRTAAFVAKILKGAKPADLPVEQPTKFELIINLKTAKTLGLTIPQSLLLRADEVIE